jgi:dCTP deaminase
MDTMRGILNDAEIASLAEKGMIIPWAQHTNELKIEDAEPQLPPRFKKVISYGVSSYGYDARIADDYKIFTNALTPTIDPKNFDSRAFIEFRGPQCVIPPNSFVLGRTFEYFKIPRDIMVLCTGKSTYARCGILINVTPLEPEWEGYVTMEISNSSPCPAIIHSFEGICQFVFWRAERSCLVSYADKKGKYQAQQDITLPRV